jgi:hypothetical protein
LVLELLKKYPVWLVVGHPVSLKRVKDCNTLPQSKNENNRKELNPTITKETIPRRVLQYKKLVSNDKIITIKAHNAM